MDKTPTPQTQEIPDVSRVMITETMDRITAVSFGHSACELAGTKEDKTACRHLLEPLDDGKGDPIDQLSDLQMANPNEFEKVTEYFNSLIMRVTERSEQKIAAQSPNATG